MTTKQTQSGKFKAAAKRTGCDENEARWEERLRQVVKQKVDKSD